MMKKLLANWPLLLLWLAFGGITVLLVAYLAVTPARIS